MVPQRVETGDNKESEYRGYANRGYRIVRKRVTIKKANTEAIQTKGAAEGGEGRQ